MELSPKGDLPIIAFASSEAWEGWLDTNHASAAGVWVKIAKKGSGISTVTYQEAVEGALCYGWIDGQKASYDGQWFLQRFTQRRSRSMWSEVNVAKIDELTAAGRMQPAGLAAVEKAKADGRWDAAYGRRAFHEVPADLQAALDADPAAGDFFAGVSRTNRYAILFRIHQAKRPETRARRIEQFVAMLAAGQTLY
ncbi:MAG: YdeI/OmpD-associated family protein [Nocardioidaceae bacterium]